MALPNKYTEIQTAVAYIVTHPQLQDKLCTFERLARPLNVLADTMNNNNIAKVDIKLLKQVFKDKNGAVQYTVSYDDLEVNNTQLEGKGYNFLFVRCNKKVGREEYNEIGRYHTRLNAFGSLKIPDDGDDDNDGHPLTKLSDANVSEIRHVYNWMDDINNIPVEVKNGLISCLREIHNKRKAQTKKDTKKRQSKDAASEQQRERADDLVQKRLQVKEEKVAAAAAAASSAASLEQQINSSVSNNNNAVNNNNNNAVPETPPRPPTPLDAIRSTLSRRKKKRRTGTAEKKKRETNEQMKARLDKEYIKLQSQVKECIEKLRANRTEVAIVEQQIQDKENESVSNSSDNNDNNDNNESSNNNNPTASTTSTNNNKSSINTKLPIYFNCNGGQVGSIMLDDGILGNGIILREDLEKQLSELPPAIDNAKANKTREKRQWTVGKYGASQVIIPNGTKLISTQYYNKLLERASVHDRLCEFVETNKCTFSREALMMITAGGLHNYGGSDEALEMIIAMTLKGLFHDIKFKVSHEQLAFSIPSRRTLARYEWYFATDCMMKVLYEIKEDGAVEVSIISDHGHRGGQDHFVIVIVWSGWKNGKKEKKVSKESLFTWLHENELLHSLLSLHTEEDHQNLLS